MSEPLPEVVRRRLVELAAQRIGELPAEDVPAALRQFVKFTPARRASLATLPIAAVLDTDEDFRIAVAAPLREQHPEVVAAIDAGSALPAADPADVAALAYLLRPQGWERYVEPIRTAEAAAEADRRHEAHERESRREAAKAQAAQARVRGAAAATDAEVARLTAELAAERVRAREAAGRVRRAEQAAADAVADRDRISAQAEAAVAAATDRETRLAAELAQARADLDSDRLARKDAKASVDARTWLLLDTLARSVSGLRDELGVAPPSVRPADAVAAALGSGPAAVARRPALVGDDPRQLDELLALPGAHLIVDGYNVTKSAYGAMALAEQRQRLIAGLVPFTARTGAEVTVVFDGADIVGVPGQTGRGVRVVYSPAGVTADEVIRRLVRAEPSGRVLVVCSADREVVDGVRSAGAHTVGPAALLARLERG